MYIEVYYVQREDRRYDHVLQVLYYVYRREIQIKAKHIPYLDQNIKSRTEISKKETEKEVKEKKKKTEKVVS